MASIRSICILRLSAIGDVCHAVAVVQAIQKTYPTADVTWIIGKVEAIMLQGLPGVKFVIFDKSEGLAAYRKLRVELPDSFDVLLHMQVAFRANLAAACIRAKRKIGYAKHLSKELHGLVINERALSPRMPHVLEGFAAFAHAIGVPPFTPSWDIPIPIDDECWMSEILAINNIEPDDLVFVVSPSASNVERNWLAERYALIIDYAAKKGFKVIICGGPSLLEKNLANDIMRYCSYKPVNMVGQTSLKQLLAVLKRADLVLSPDSGPAHMATTQGTPVIGLYAHSNPARTGPYYSQAIVVEVYHANILKQTGQVASRLKWGRRLKGDNLMCGIVVDDVVKQFNRVTKELPLGA